MSIAQEKPVIGPRMAGTLMPPEEFDSVESWEPGYVYELINGVLVVNPPPGEGERGPNGLLDYCLRLYKERHPDGKALDYTLAEHTIKTKRNRRRADRVIWAGLGRMPNVRRDQPTIVIEFVSKERRDRIRDYEAKRDEYMEIQIAEYWIIGRFRRTMTVYRRRDGDYEQLVLPEKKTYATPRLPGFELSLEQVFAEADMLEKAMSDNGDRV